MMILVVDDDPANRYATTRTLEAAGFDVRETGAGEHRVQLARTLVPDLVVLDLRLRGIDGFEVCRRLKAERCTAAVPVLMKTAARWDDDVRPRALESGAIDVIVGAEATGLLPIVRRVLGRPDPRHAVS